MANGNIFPSRDSDSAMETAHHFRINLQNSSRAFLLETEITAKQLSDTYASSEHVCEWRKYWTCNYFFFPATQHLPRNQTELEQHWWGSERALNPEVPILHKLQELFPKAFCRRHWIVQVFVTTGVYFSHFFKYVWSSVVIRRVQ